MALRKEANVRDGPQEGDRVVESKTGHAGTVVEGDGHDPSTVYVLFDYQRPSSQPKLRAISELTIVSKPMREATTGSPRHASYLGTVPTASATPEREESGRDRPGTCHATLTPLSLSPVEQS